MLVDAEGRRFLDAEAANGTVALGYDRTILADAQALAAPLPALPSFVESELRLDAARALVQWFRQALDAPGRVAFELGGAQGIELALKIARANCQATAIAVFEGAYHGRSIFTSQLSSSARYRRHGFNIATPILRLPHPERAARFGGDPEQSTARALEFIERTLSDDQCGAPEQWCALVVEPVLNVGGMTYPERSYLRGVVDAFRRRGALIIADEVFSGFYRTGTALGMLHYGIVPDIVVTSKGLSNGLVPVSCVWARDPLLSAECFPPGTHSVTYANNPLNMAVVLAVLQRYARWTDIASDVERLGQRLGAALARLRDRHDVVQSVEARGATARLVLKQPVAGRVRILARTIGERGSINGHTGALVASTGMAPHVVALCPPLVFTEADVADLEAILDAAFARL